MSRFIKAKSVLLLFDFDGTLAPIRKHPDRVRLSDTNRKRLIALSKAQKCHVGIVSGRPVRELQKRVGIPGLLYIGNHGFEIQKGSHLFVHPAANAKSGLLRSLATEIQSALAAIPGAWLEDKGCTLSIHFRLVPASKAGQIRDIVYGIVRARTVPGGLFIKTGKKVIEIRPERTWHKGSAVDLARRAEPPPTCVLYAGDDVTDEDVFRMMSRQDVSIHVGCNTRSKAQYCVRHPADIQKLLAMLARMFQNVAVSR